MRSIATQRAACYDPLGGYADIASRRVRFIGDAHDRIREDYLRILRFFRFGAEYTQGAPDAAGLAAAIELRGGLDQLSGERVRAELLRLLAAPRAVETVRVMEEAGVLDHVLGTRLKRAVDVLAKTAEIERMLGRDADPVLHLGALAGARPGAALALRDRLKLSTAEFERLARMAIGDTAFDPATSEREARAFIYRYGSEAFLDGAVLSWAQCRGRGEQRPAPRAGHARPPLEGTRDASAGRRRAGARRHRRTRGRPRRARLRGLVDRRGFSGYFERIAATLTGLSRSGAT